jgi:hypothetical protein
MVLILKVGEEEVVLVAEVDFPDQILGALVEGEDMVEGVAMRMAAGVAFPVQVVEVEASVEGEATTTPPSVVADSMVAEEDSVVDSSSTPLSQLSLNSHNASYTTTMSKFLCYIFRRTKPYLFIHHTTTTSEHDSEKGRTLKQSLGPQAPR